MIHSYTGRRCARCCASSLVRELVRASEFVGFELTEFEAPMNPEHRANAVQTVIRMIEPVFLAGPVCGKRVYEPCGETLSLGAKQ